MGDVVAERFLDACQHFRWHRSSFARRVLEPFVLDHVGAHLDNDALIAHIMAEALLRRVDRNLLESRNIYVERYEIPQIEMFYRMAECYPHVPESHRVANRLLAREMRRHTSVAWLEIGIGKGRQVAAALDLLARDPGQCARVEIVAVDPDADNLRDSHRLLRARDLPFRVHFHAISGFLEQLGTDTFSGLQHLAEARVANSAYAFHHTTHVPGDGALRTRLLRRVADIGPSLFTLVEPDSDHDTEDVASRFQNSWRHFGTAFRLIDESALPAEVRFAVKEVFFGRELRDLFGVSDSFRCERHEGCMAWMLRLLRAGFVPADVAGIPVELPEHSDAAIGEGVIRLRYRGTPLISVLAFRAPDPEPAS
jgi:hypothetical protein